MNTFLDQKDLEELTGRKMKTRQIAALREMGIPFFINATGHPVVTRSAVEGRKEESPKAAWVPRLLRTAG